MERTKHDWLIDIICIAMCAVICGADSWVAVETFGKAKQTWLERYLALPNGIPSHGSFGRLFAALDAEQFQLHFIVLLRAIWRRQAGEVKTLRGSHQRASGTSG